MGALVAGAVIGWGGTDVALGLIIGGLVQMILFLGGAAARK